MTRALSDARVWCSHCSRRPCIYGGIIIFRPLSPMPARSFEEFGVQYTDLKGLYEVTV